MVKVVRNCSFVSAVWGILIFITMMIIITIAGIGNASMLDRMHDELKLVGGVDAIFLAGGGLWIFLPSS
jgi:hypothetical protein